MKGKLYKYRGDVRLPQQKGVRPHYEIVTLQKKERNRAPSSISQARLFHAWDFSLMYLLTSLLHYIIVFHYRSFDLLSGSKLFAGGFLLSL
jgi:hypothetical protein